MKNKTQNNKTCKEYSRYLSTQFINAATITDFLKQNPITPTETKEALQTYKLKNYSTHSYKTKNYPTRKLDRDP